MTQETFVMARNNVRAELVQGSFPPDIAPGHKFDRMRGCTKESWTVVKVFEPDSQRHLQALQVLMDAGDLDTLFEFELAGFIA